MIFLCKSKKEKSKRWQNHRLNNLMVVGRNRAGGRHYNSPEIIEPVVIGLAPAVHFSMQVLVDDNMYSLLQVMQADLAAGSHDKQF